MQWQPCQLSDFTFAGSGTAVHWSGADLALDRVVIPAADYTR